MAGFFDNFRLSSVEQNTSDDNGSAPSAAYATANNSIPNVTPSTEPIPAQGAQTNTVTIQAIPEGFGSYLDGILPPDIAKAAGAFSVAMQQIKNISNIPVEKFAQVATNLETTKGLNVNGSSVPTDTSLASQGLALIALGNGPYGTYTMSNFLGCMSGLPYVGINLASLIQQVETTTLSDIYKNLYLAVTWEQATATFDGSTFTYTNRGGGYGRGSTLPTVTVDGNPAVVSIGTDPTNITTFGRIIAIIYTGSAGSVVIDSPPGAGWLGMNTVIQSYIDAANIEILSIQNSKPELVQQLNTNWNDTGVFLATEQRAIGLGLTVGVPTSSPDHEREPAIASYPTTQYSFIDSIPRYAMFTQPHMYSQTLEAIANYDTVGGRSIVAMLRQERNQNRLQEAGIPLDNNIDSTLTKQQETELIANGVLGGSVPATLVTAIGSPNSAGYYNPTDDRYYSNGVAIDNGQADEPGSFAGSRYQNLISPQLSVVYTSDVLLPATYSIPEAINEVIRCNCDCWANI
jgi:hypothetical protein